MKIAIDARTMAQAERLTGVGTVVSLLAAHCAVRGVRATLLYDRTPSWRQPAHDQRVLSARSRPVWEQWQLPKEIRRGAYDLVHLTWNYGLPALRPRFARWIVTVHDLIPLASPPERSTLRDQLWWTYYRWSTRYSLRHADAIVAVSEATAAAIRQYDPTTVDRLTVIANPVQPVFLAPITEDAIDEVRRRYGLTGRYLVYSGGFDERKRIDLAIEALEHLPSSLNLVLVGQENDHARRLVDLARRRGVAERVQLPGYVPLADLPALIAGSAVSVYPSRAEGFGYPVAEALATGTPVVTTSIPALQEIGGSFPGYVAPTVRAKAFAAAVRPYLAWSAGQRRLFGQAARRWAARYSAATAGQAMLALYERVRGERRVNAS